MALGDPAFSEFDRSGEHVHQRVYDIERRGMHAAIRVIERLADEADHDVGGKGPGLACQIRDGTDADPRLLEESLDGEARRQYRGRLQQLRQDLAEALIKQEIERLKAELQKT